MLSANDALLASPNVSDAHGMRILGRTFMLNTNYGAAQSDSHIGIGVVKMRIVNRGLNNRAHRLLARQSGRYEPADEKPRDGSVTIGKMKKVRAFVEILGKFQAKSIEADGAKLGGFQSRHGVDSFIVAPTVSQE